MKQIGETERFELNEYDVSLLERFGDCTYVQFAMVLVGPIDKTAELHEAITRAFNTMNMSELASLCMAISPPTLISKSIYQTSGEKPN